MSFWGPSIKIRERTRRGHVRESGGHGEWVEYQVVRGHKIVSRHELRNHAEKAMAELIAATTIPPEDK